MCVASASANLKILGGAAPPRPSSIRTTMVRSCNFIVPNLFIAAHRVAFYNIEGPPRGYGEQGNLLFF